MRRLKVSVCRQLKILMWRPISCRDEQPTSNCVGKLSPAKSQPAATGSALLHVTKLLYKLLSTFRTPNVDFRRKGRPFISNFFHFFSAFFIQQGRYNLFHLRLFACLFTRIFGLSFSEIWLSCCSSLPG